MTASFHLGNRVGDPEPVAAGTTIFIAPTASVEDAATASGRIIIREDGTIDLGFLRVATNTLSDSCTFTLRVNGVDSALVIPVASGLGIFEDLTHSVAASAGDDVGWTAVAAAGTGSLAYSMLGFRFTPDDATHCVTFVSAFNAGSTAMTTASETRFFALNGTRGTGTTAEGDATLRIPEPFTIRGLYGVQGTNSRADATVLGFRSEAADLAPDLSIAGGSAAGPYDESPQEEDAINADDDVCSFVRLGAGAGTFNLERVVGELVSLGNKFLFITGDTGNGLSVTADAFIPLAGQITQSATESDVELRVRFAFRLHHLMVFVPSNTGSQNGATLVVRKNGADEELLCRFNAATGLFENVNKWVDLAPGDTACLKIRDVSGTIRVRNILLVADATMQGGGEMPASTPLAHDANSDSGTFTTTSPFTWTHRPSVQNPMGVVVRITQTPGSTDRVTAVSYGGVEMARVISGFDAATEPSRSYLYFLGTGIPEGNQTVSITHDGSTDNKRAICSTLAANNETVVIASDQLSGNQASPVTVALDSGIRAAQRYYAMVSGLNVAANVTPAAGMSEDLETNLNSNVHNFGRDTTPVSGSVNTGVTTSASDDVSLAAAAVIEVPTPIVKQTSAQEARLRR